MTVNNDPGECGATVTVIPPLADDECNIVISSTNNYNNSNISTTFYPVGTTVVTWSALDNCGNTTSSCSHSITVRDNEKPSIQCMAQDTTIQAERGAYGAIVSFPLPTFQDNCGASLVASHPSGSFFPCGQTTVTYTAVDSSGNSSDACVFLITVECDVDIDFPGVDCGMAVSTQYSGDRNSNDPFDNVLNIIDLRVRDFP